MSGAAQRVHSLFRGAAEFAKSLRFYALLMELAAAVISLVGILGPANLKSPWLPLLLLGLTALSTVLRAAAGQFGAYSHRCRKISLRAFSFGREVDHLTVLLLDDDAPPLVDRFVSKLPAQSLDDYYEPTCPPGESRLAELYAHSAFYTWRLLRVYGFLLGALGIVVFVGSSAVIYWLASDAASSADRKSVLEAICTVILVLLSVRALDMAWSALSSSWSVRSIENTLLTVPRGEALTDLVDSYDIETARAPSPPTIIYRLRRNSLASKWYARRAGFVNCDVSGHQK